MSSQYHVMLDAVKLLEAETKARLKAKALDQVVDVYVDTWYDTRLNEAVKRHAKMMASD